VIKKYAHPIFSGIDAELDVVRLIIDDVDILANLELGKQRTCRRELKD
jgi:hypothetical protein